jgi:hypothetical protein
MERVVIVVGSLALLLVGSAGVARGIQEPMALAVDDPEAYVVYATLLPDEWTIRDAKAKRLVIQEETATNWECMPSGDAMKTTWKPVLDAYRVANAQPHRILPNEPLGIPYDVVPAKTIALSFDKRVANGVSDGWSGFYRKHPDSGGYLQMSAVAFDAAKMRAMVYIAHSCGGLCGGGTHHLLEKVEGAWRAATIPGLSQCQWAS